MNRILLAMVLVGLLFGCVLPADRGLLLVGTWRAEVDFGYGLGAVEIEFRDDGTLTWKGFTGGVTKYSIDGVYEHDYTYIHIRLYPDNAPIQPFELLYSFPDIDHLKLSYSLADYAYYFEWVN